MSAITEFQNQHHQILRALSESIHREGELHRQLRRLKDKLISVSLQLQVAIRISRDDELTIASLRKEAYDATLTAATAKKQSEEASDLIQSLNYEIRGLKRKVQLFQAPELKSNSVSFVAVDSDKDIDEMMNRPFTPHISSSPIRPKSSHIRSGSPVTFQTQSISSPFHSPSKSQSTSAPSHPISPPHTRPFALSASLPSDFFSSFSSSSSLLPPSSSPSPFQTWKASHFLYSSDTPQASEHHDPQAVQMMQDLDLLKEVGVLGEGQDGLGLLSGLRRSTKSRAGKLRKLTSSLAHAREERVDGSGKGVGVSWKDLSEPSPNTLNPSPNKALVSSSSLPSLPFSPPPVSSLSTLQRTSSSSSKHIPAQSISSLQSSLLFSPINKKKVLT